MKGFALVMSSLVLFASGCSNSIEQEDFCTEYAKAACETEVKCCTTKSIDPASCESGFKTFCERNLISAVEAKKSTYNASEAAECVSFIRSQQDECKEAEDTDGSCNAAFVGTIPEGGDCKDFFTACAKGLSCFLRVTGEVTTGTCVKPAGEGQSCANAPCDDNLSCVNDTCKREVAIGGDCSEAQCVPGAYCDFQTDKCMARKDTGAACGRGSECKSFQCTNGTCADGGGATSGFCLSP